MKETDPGFKAMVDQFTAMSNEMSRIWGDYWKKLMEQQIPYEVASVMIQEAHREFWRKQLGFDI